MTTPTPSGEDAARRAESAAVRAEAAAERAERAAASSTDTTTPSPRPDPPQGRVGRGLPDGSTAWVLPS